jgi:electron transport complex protein RnfE
MGRAEAFASKNSVLRSLLDGIGMSIGFAAVITLMGVIREFLGAGTLFNRPVLGAGFTPVLVFILPPGAFLVLGFLIAAQKRISHAREAKT